MKNIKIKNMIATGMVLLIILIAGLSYYAYSKIIFITEEKMVHAQASENLIKTMLSIRKDEKDYLLRELSNPDYFQSGNSKYVTSMSEKDQEIENILSKLETFSKSEELALIENFETSYNKYTSTFNQLQEEILRKGFKDFGLEGDLRASVHDVEIALEGVENHPELTITMLQLRRNEKDYMLRSDIKYQDKLHKNVTLFKEQVNTSGLDADIIATLNKSIEAYKTSFNALVAVDDAIGRSSSEGLMGQYRQAAHDMNEVGYALNQLVIESIDAEKGQVVSRLIVFALFILIGAGALGIILATAVNKSIGEAQKDVSALTVGEGDLTHKVYQGEKNEMGELKSYIQAFIDMTREIIANVIRGTNHLQESSYEINLAVDEANRNVEEISNRMSSIVSSIEASSGSVQQVTASTHELAHTATEVYNKASEISSISDEALGSIEVGAEKIDDIVTSVDNLESSSKQVVTAVTKLEEYSRDIVNIVDIIQGISEQTNLLALNASIEAARAGEHGKGFAVVAEEVRLLAEESNNSTQKINSLITQIQEMVNETKQAIEGESKLIVVSVQSSERAKEEFGVIDGKIQGIIGMVSEILNLSKLQAETSDSISKSMDEISQTSEENTAASVEISENIETQVAIFEEVGASLAELKNVAGELRGETSKFKVE